MNDKRCVMLICAFAAALISSPPAIHAQPVPPRLPDGARVVNDAPYVKEGHERQVLDLYLPAEGKDWPLVVWVHGGAWRGGNKDRPPALRLLREGYAVASINYRLSQHAKFPAQIQDAKAAIRWLRAQAKEYGYDSGRIGVWGASAGGHIVALLGTTGDEKEFDVGPNLDQSSAVQAVIDFFGPTDFLQIQAQTGDTGRLNHDAPDSPEAHLLGGPVQENPDKAIRANPISYVSVDDPPFLIMHGEEDDVVPIGQSELLHAALEKAGVPSKLQRIPDAGHGFGGPEIERAVLAFFNRHLQDTSRGATRR